MAFDLSKLAHLYDFDLQTDGLGHLRCRSLTSNTPASLEKRIKSHELDSVALAGSLLGHIGQKHENGQKAQEEMDEDARDSSLSEDDLARLTENDIQTFARKFIDHNQWLLESCEDARRSVRTDDDGKPVVSIKPNTVDLPKGENERDSDHLVRVLRRYLEEQARRLKRIVDPFSDRLSKNMFSDSTQELLKRHFSLSDQLQETLRSFDRGGIIGDRTPMGLGKPSLFELPASIPENPIHETNRRLNLVLNRIESMSPIVSQSAELFRSMSDTALQMHADFNRSSRRSERFSLLVIFIAAASLCVTALYSWWSYEDAQRRDVEGQRALDAYQAQVNTILSAQANQIETMIRAVLADARVQSNEESQALIDALTEAFREVGASRRGEDPPDER